MSILLLLLFSFAQVSKSSTLTYLYQTNTSSCQQLPDIARVTPNSTCTALTCSPSIAGFGTRSCNDSSISTLNLAKTIFPSSSYFAYDVFTSSACSSLAYGYIYQANSCISYRDNSSSIIFSIAANLSVILKTYSGPECSASILEPTTQVFYAAGTLYLPFSLPPTNPISVDMSTTDCTDISTSHLTGNYTYGRFYSSAFVAGKLKTSNQQGAHSSSGVWLLAVAISLSILLMPQ